MRRVRSEKGEEGEEESGGMRRVRDEEGEE